MPRAKERDIAAGFRRPGQLQIRWTRIGESGAHIGLIAIEAGMSLWRHHDGDDLLAALEGEAQPFPVVVANDGMNVMVSERPQKPVIAPDYPDAMVSGRRLKRREGHVTSQIPGAEQRNDQRRKPCRCRVRAEGTHAEHAIEK